MFDGLKVFTATKQKERSELGDVATAWLDKRHDSVEIVDRVVSQSSDQQFHCLTIVLFYRHRVPPAES